MNFFSIDCSIDFCSLFIKLENKTINKVLQSDKFSNDLLMKNILDFFTEKNLNFDQLDAIFVNQGPGNFSGLRTSLAIAKGISISKNLGLYGYNTFLWSCVKFLNKENTICSIIKLKEKYFIKRFDKNLKNISKVQEITEENIIKHYSKELKVIPASLKKNFDHKILKLSNLCIVKLDHNMLESLQLEGLLNKDLIKPLYLS
jgi:tRNA threonylcarbamoyl adenosine modification protein YeaZ